MKKSSKQILSLFVRYAIIVLISFPNLYLFYAIFTPLTLYPVFFLLSLFFKASLSENIILLQGFSIEIIQACVAGSAYYLLFILNISVPDIKISRRIKMILLSFAALLVVNVLRIFLLSLMVFYGSSYFEITHKLFWYILSTIFVIVIWFAEVRIFKIKQIPIYSDLKFSFQGLLKKSH